MPTPQVSARNQGVTPRLDDLPKKKRPGKVRTPREEGAAGEEVEVHALVKESTLPLEPLQETESPRPPPDFDLSPPLGEAEAGQPRIQPGGPAMKTPMHSASGGRPSAVPALRGEAAAGYPLPVEAAAAYQPPADITGGLDMLEAVAERLREVKGGQEASEGDRSEQGSDSEDEDLDELNIPEEVTPMKIVKPSTAKSMPIISENGSVCHPASECPTSIYTQDYDEGSELFMDGPDFEVWLKGLPIGQRMRVQERLAVRNNIRRAQNAIRLISSNTGEHDMATWDAAAEWQLAFREFDSHQLYLEHFGYKLADEKQWQEASSATGPQLDFQVDGHVSKAGHTWYNVRCKLSRVGIVGTDTIEWLAPRRLVQLRVDLHHRVREMLGPAYDEQFGATRFAKFGGPPGTTARLRSWFDTLASCINKGIAPPVLVTLALIFMQAPVPEGMEVPAGGAALRQTGDCHSNLGGSESQSNLGG